MSYLYNLIRVAFEWALFLGLVGGLGEATVTLCKEAGHARAHDLISLSRLNRSLVGDAGLQRSRAAPHDSPGQSR